jgi:Ca-activated chloride channel family protein
MNLNRLHKASAAPAVLIGLALFLGGGTAMAKVDMNLTMRLSTPKMLAGQKQTAYLRVGLIGRSEELKKRRAPVNVSLVLDHSGSMSGAKLERAKEAALMFVERLRGDDIVSVVIYDTTVEVLVPATKVSDKEDIRLRISRIRSGNRTALFAGVSKGAAETRKFLSPQRVNRVVLLSDGLANVGPSTPEDLAALGESLIREGISVTTIGLGLDYNEDLMYRLAAASDGNPVFAQSAGDLAGIFDRELLSVTDVVASQADLEVTVAEGVRPVRVLGRRADIEGRQVKVRFNQIYHDWENYILLEVELPPSKAGQVRPVATAAASFLDLATETRRTLRNEISAAFTDSESAVEKSRDADVMVAAVALIAAENNQEAVKLRDLGKIDEATRALLANADFVARHNQELQSQHLTEIESRNRNDATNQAGERWAAQRKLQQAVTQIEVYRVQQ